MKQKLKNPKLVYFGIVGFVIVVGISQVALGIISGYYYQNFQNSIYVAAQMGPQYVSNEDASAAIYITLAQFMLWVVYLLITATISTIVAVAFTMNIQKSQKSVSGGKIKSDNAAEMQALILKVVKTK